MKYSVDDKIKVLEVDADDEDEKERFLNKIKNIVDVWEDNEEEYYYGLENENWGYLYFKESQLLDMRRDYVVIICMRHSGVIRDALLFWGSKTDDYAKRSTSGYTVDINECERYTYDEVLENGFDIIDKTAKGIPKTGDFAIKIEDLLSFGFKQLTIVC